MKRLLHVITLLLPWFLLISVTMSAETPTLEKLVTEAIQQGPASQQANLIWDQDQLAWQQAIAASGFTLNSAVDGKVSGWPVGSSVSSSNVNIGSSFSTIGNTLNPGASAKLILSSPLTNATLQAAQDFPLDGSIEKTSVSVGLTLSQTLWDGYVGGIGSATLRQAQIQLELRRLVWLDALDTAARDVRSAFTAVIAARRSLEATIASSNSLLLEQQREIQLKAVGQATDLDLRRAKTAAEIGLQDVLAARNSLTNSTAVLAGLLGRNSDEGLDQLTMPENSEIAPNRTKSLDRALTHRTEILNWKLNLQAARIALDLKKGALSPSVNLTGGVTLIQPWNNPSGTKLGVTAGISLGASLYNGNSIDNGITAAEKAIKVLESEEKQIIASITRNIDLALFSLSDANSRVFLAQNNATVAKETWEGTRIKQQAGLATNADVLAAMALWIKAESDATIAINKRDAAWLTLQKAEGLSL